MKHRRPLALKVIYLFAGKKRRADIQECLSTLIARINARAEFDLFIELDFTAVDLLRGGECHDLLSAARRRH